MDVEDLCSAAFQILTDRDVADEYEAFDDLLIHATHAQLESVKHKLVDRRIELLPG